MVEVGDLIRAQELVFSDDGEIHNVHAGVYRVTEIDRDLQGVRYWVEAKYPTFFYDFETLPLDNDDEIEYTTEVVK